MRPLRALGSLTTWSLAALVLGCLLGALGHSSGSPAIARFAEALDPLGDLWIAALGVIVLPLVIFHVMAVIVDVRHRDSVGGLGVRAIILFVTMLLAVGLITLAAAWVIVGRLPTDPALMAAFASATPTLPPSPALIPLAGNVLPLLVAGTLLAFIVTRLPDPPRALLSRGIRATARTMLAITRRVLWLLPLGVFVFVFPVVLEAGGGMTGFLGTYVGIQCGLVLAITLLLYPVTSIFGRIPLADFARGVAPAQLVAGSTRSSIAALPALVQGGRERLRLPSSATGVVLPLAIALFKLSRTVSAPLRLLVLAQVYDIPLAAGTIGIFLATVILLSFGTVGLPSGVLPVPTLPAYVAAGMPIEGVLILEAVDAIPDIFKTVLNVTGDMSAATILARGRRDAVGSAAPDGEPLFLPDAA